MDFLFVSLFNCCVCAHALILFFDRLALKSNELNQIESIYSEFEQLKKRKKRKQKNIKPLNFTYYACVCNESI